MTFLPTVEAEKAKKGKKRKGSGAPSRMRRRRDRGQPEFVGPRGQQIPEVSSGPARDIGGAPCSLQLLVILVPVIFGLMGFALDLGRL